MFNLSKSHQRPIIRWQKQNVDYEHGWTPHLEMKKLKIQILIVKHNTTTQVIQHKKLYSKVNGDVRDALSKANTPSPNLNNQSHVTSYVLHILEYLDQIYVRCSARSIIRIAC